jgi:hypothetical protein
MSKPFTKRGEFIAESPSTACGGPFCASISKNRVFFFGQANTKLGY